MSGRFEVPTVGPPVPVRFPAVARESLANGLRVWSIAQRAVPVVSLVLVIDSGTAADPTDRPGLAGLVADLIDEGAGSRNAIELSDALARIGSHLEIGVGPDVTTVGLTTLARFLQPAMDLVADVAMRPHLSEPDLVRVRELRLNRLRQMRRLPGTAADRALLGAVFSAHAYGHGAYGTTRSLQVLTLDEARRFWADAFGPGRAALVIAGDVTPSEGVAAARSSFGSWSGPAARTPIDPVPPGPGSGQLLLVHRPGSPQSELRVGHAGPPRRSAAYHTLITLNAILGGQFSSRINRTLRETMGVTYGARTAFDFRAAGGSFACEASVAADATTVALTEILAEFRAMRADGAVQAEELARAKASLTRGYVRHFETAGQLAHAAVQQATYGLDADEFDRFVPRVEAVTASDLSTAAREFLRPDEAAIVVVGDADRCADALGSLARPVITFEPEF